MTFNQADTAEAALEATSSWLINASHEPNWIDRFRADQQSQLSRTIADETANPVANHIRTGIGMVRDPAQILLGPATSVSNAAGRGAVLGAMRGVGDASRRQQSGSGAAKSILENAAIGAVGGTAFYRLFGGPK